MKFLSIFAFHAVALTAALCSAKATEAPKGGSMGKGCLTQAHGQELMKKWVRIFSGLDDSAVKESRALLDDKFQLFSQSQWFVTPNNSYLGPEAHGPYPVDYPPIYANPDSLLNDPSNHSPYDANKFITGPVIVGCHSFSFYWKFDVGINPNLGRVNGIDMVFFNDDNKKIKVAYSEMNTANLFQMFGEHPTSKSWGECPF